MLFVFSFFEIYDIMNTNKGIAKNTEEFDHEIETALPDRYE